MRERLRGVHALSRVGNGTSPLPTRCGSRLSAAEWPAHVGKGVAAPAKLTRRAFAHPTFTGLRLRSALLRRGAAPRALSRLAAHACGQSVPHREFDLTAPHADVLQHTIVEPLERTNGAALASFGSQASRHFNAPQDKHAQPFCGRAHGGAHAGRNDEIAFNRGLPLEFEERNRRARMIFHGHGLLLHGPVASMLLRGAGSMPRRAARELRRLARSGPASWKQRFARAGVFLEIFCRCSKITPNQGGFLK
jgi:hypothetical protein